MDEFEISRATAFRDIAYLSERLRAPIAFDPDSETYRYDWSRAATTAKRFELPGLWLLRHEIAAMRIAIRLLESTFFKSVNSNLQLLRRRFDFIEDDGKVVLEDHVLCVPVVYYPVDQQIMQEAAKALKARSAVRVRFPVPSSTNAAVSFDATPLRLTHLDGVWLLELQRHDTDRHEAIPVTALAHLKALDTPARDIPLATFTSASVLRPRLTHDACHHEAVIRFSRKVASRERDRRWHADEARAYDIKGDLIARIPYQDPEWLVARVLAMGDDATVVSPPKLRTEVMAALQAAITQYD